MLEKLDFDEFFLEEYSKVDRGFGIGGAGIITNKQMINVFNVSDELKKDLNGWAQGAHLVTFNEILKRVYGDEIDDADLNYLLMNLIHIHYINWSSIFDKYIEINIPAYVSKSQYKNLLKLNKIIDKLSLKYNISVNVKIDKVLISSLAGKMNEQVFFDKRNKNNLFEALVYLKKNNKIDDDKVEVSPYVEKKFVYEKRIKVK